MARLLKADKMSEPPRVRRLSFKTKARTAVRVSVSPGKVAVIASKFNAVVEEDELKGRALVKLHNQPVGKVRAAISKFENLEPTSKVVLLRKSSVRVEERKPVVEAVCDSGMEEKPAVKAPSKSTIGRKSNQRYVNKDFKELLGKDKKFSLPKTQILDEAFNETVHVACKTSSETKRESKAPVPSKTVPKQNISPAEPESITNPGNNYKNESKSEEPTEPIEQPLKTSSLERNKKPNSSFLWGAKDSVQNSTKETTKPVCNAKSDIKEIINLENLKESSVDDQENDYLNIDEVEAASDKLVENKENLEKLETPIIRTTDKKGYGKINVPVNNSSLYRNIERQRLLGEVKERLKTVEKNDEINEKTEIKVSSEKQGTRVIAINKTERLIENETKETNDNNKTDKTDRTHFYKVSSDRGYEMIDQGVYEIVENSYDVIKNGDEEDTIYDDVHINHTDRIYESIYNGRLPNDSDSSCEQSNSLYGVRPPSQASSGGSGTALRGGTSRSDTSDDWVDIELSSSEERKGQIVLIQQGTPRVRGEGWSVKVRRQWSTRSTNQYISTNDSDTSSKHYELIDNPDNDSAVGDEFDDSSDSEFSVHNFKPNVEERLRPEVVSQSDGIYGLMKEAGKKMKQTSSTISKRLRIISRISSKQSAQDLFNGGTNGVVRGKWPSFKKKPVLGKSTFYLNEVNEQKSTIPPPRPPPPTTVDPRRYSITMRPTSPPPPPPIYTNVKDKEKAINESILYTESGLFQQNHPNTERKSNNINWYSDVGLYENSTLKISDTSSEHGSSQGSDIDLRFADEPLYQFYTERIAEQELSDLVSEAEYEEIGANRPGKMRPSALDLVSTEMNRTLWCQVPQVIASGILDTLTPENKKLQEAKFEVLTSEASYYKSLSILDKHFASSPLLKDEKVLPKVHYKTFFGNLSAIRKCSEAVLAALDKCWQESILLDGLSDAISQVAETHFSAYKDYCSNQLFIERTLNMLKKTNQAFVEALETLENSPKCQHLTFYSFVLLPMQRITRMPLLLDAIYTKLDSSHPEYQSCGRTLTILHKIVHECNEAARLTERLQEMASVSRAIQFPPTIRELPLFSASRWLVRSGEMTQVSLESRATFSKKRSALKSNKLKLFLFNDYLVITKKKLENCFTVITYCERNLVQMKDTDETNPNRFLIMLTLLKNHEDKTQEMVVCCEGESSRARWIAALTPPAPTDPGDTAIYEDWDCPQVCAVHAYVAAEPDELALQYGDIMNVFRKTADGWYYGERTRDTEKGWFPGNHTKEILSSHVRARNLRQRHRLLALSADFIKKQKSNKTVS